MWIENVQVSNNQWIHLEFCDSYWSRRSGCYRAVGADDFFTSISWGKCLLEDDAYFIGTLRMNRAGSDGEIVWTNLRRGEVDGLQDRDDIKLIKCKDRKVSWWDLESYRIHQLWWVLGVLVVKMNVSWSHEVYSITRKENQVVICVISYHPIARVLGGQ